MTGEKHNSKIREFDKFFTLAPPICNAEIVFDATMDAQVIGSPPRQPIDPVTGQVDESEVPLDEIQSRFFLLRDDGGVGCRYCLNFHTLEQIRPLYPLRDHVHSVHYKIFPYRCSDCAFKVNNIFRVTATHWRSSLV